MGPTATHLPMAMKGVGTLLKTAGEFRAGRIAAAKGRGTEAAKRLEARGLQARAGQERARSQRLAEDVRREEDLVQSAIQARAAASGTGGPGIENIQKDVAEEGAFRAATALFSGEETARGLRDIAGLREFEGSIARLRGKRLERAGREKALATLLSGLADI